MNYREQVWDLLRKRPFEAFRVTTKDGRQFDIEYWEPNLVLKSFMEIGEPIIHEGIPLAGTITRVPWDEFASIAPLSTEVLSKF